jgi:hypothetical protein
MRADGSVVFEARDYMYNRLDKKTADFVVPAAGAAPTGAATPPPGAGAPPPHADAGAGAAEPDDGDDAAE